MANKMLILKNCGECPYCDTITSTKEEKSCLKVYADEKKTGFKIIPDWEKIPDWCPLPDAP